MRSLLEAGHAACTRSTSAWSSAALFPRSTSLCRPAVTMRKCCGSIRRYIDAKLIVGVHQYVTGSLPFGLKILAGAAGITGSKSKGIQ